MAAAQVAGTPAAEPVAAPPSPLSEDSSGIGLEAALAQLEPPGEDDAPAEDAPAAKAEVPAAPPAPGKPLDPLSAEAIAQPGGIEKAQAFLKEKQREHDRAYLKVKDREQRLKHDAERFKSELGQSRAFVQSIQADLQLLTDGNAEQKLEALGRLTRGKDPLKVWEEISITAASGGKKAPSPEAQELARQIAELRAEREAERAAAVEQQQVQQLNQLRGQMLQGAQSATEEFPALAHFASAKPREVVEYLNDMIVAAHGSGQPMTWAQAYAQLNAELAPHFSAVQPAQGLATLTAPAAKPVAPTQRSPGRSLNPSLATRPAAAVREMTEAERIAELASDPDFLGSLF